MRNNTLLKPLIHSALILILLSTLFYMIASSPEATACGAIKSSFIIIVISFFSTIQWLTGMLIALIACLAFLFAIFLGAVAIFDLEIAAQMYRSLKTGLLDSVHPLIGQCCTCGC